MLPASLVSQAGVCMFVWGEYVCRRGRGHVFMGKYSSFTPVPQYYYVLWVILIQV